MAEKFQTGGVLFHGDAVTDAGTTQLFPLGFIREEDGKRYRYVKYDKGAGSIACIKDGLSSFIADDATGQKYWTITNDISASDVGKALVAGSATAIIADGGFGWMQTQGFKTLTTAAVGAVGDLVGIANSDAGVPEVTTVLGTVAGKCNAALSTSGGTFTFCYLTLN